MIGFCPEALPATGVGPHEDVALTQVGDEPSHMHCECRAGPDA
jgi:hypothetical protein